MQSRGLHSASGGIRRSMQSHGCFIAAIALRAGSLLLVLLAHLAFMASPLHAAMLDGAGASRGAAMSDAYLPAQVAQAGADGGHSGHCVLEWARSSEWLGIVPFMVAAAVGGIGGSPIEVALPSLVRATARALGPPLRGDPQAVLQVFRE